MHAQLALYEHCDSAPTNNATTLDIVDGRLWFGTRKLFTAGDKPVYSIRLGWRRRVTFTLTILHLAGQLPGENVYVGEFLDIHPNDLREIREIILGADYTDICDVSSQAACAA